MHRWSRQASCRGVKATSLTVRNAATPHRVRRHANRLTIARDVARGGVKGSSRLGVLSQQEVARLRSPGEMRRKGRASEDCERRGGASVGRCEGCRPAGACKAAFGVEEEVALRAIADAQNKLANERELLRREGDRQGKRCWQTRQRMMLHVTEGQR